MSVNNSTLFAGNAGVVPCGSPLLMVYSAKQGQCLMISFTV